MRNERSNGGALTGYSPVVPSPWLLFLFNVVLAMGAVAQDGPGTSPFRLNVQGRVMDADDKALDQCRVRVEQDGKELVDRACEAKGRFNLYLDIGGLYSIDTYREGYVKKRFIVDARTDDPSKVVTVPFEAHISLMDEASFEGADMEQLDFPFAMVTYSRKEKAFMADPGYIEEMKKLESALMLSAVLFQRKQKK